jgi:hypothetical protein
MLEEQLSIWVRVQFNTTNEKMKLKIGKMNKSNEDDEFDDDDINFRDLSKGIDLDEKSGDDENK